MKGTKTRGIVTKIMAIQNLCEEEKAGSFFNGLEKYYSSRISKLEHDLKSYEFKYNSEADVLQDRLADAKEDLDNAWLYIDKDKIQTREDQKTYINEYDTNISRSTAIVENLENELEELNKLYEETVNNTESQISEYKLRLNKIQ